MRLGTWIAHGMIAALLVLSLPGTALANEREYKVEAAFLYNFLNYITWPGYAGPEQMDAGTICVVGDDPIHPYLRYVQYKMAEERTLTLRKVGLWEKLKGCHIVYVREVRGDAMKSLIARARSEKALLVSSTPHFISRGGMIGISHYGQRIATEINNTMLKDLGFEVSSRMLALARRVR